MAFKQNWSTHLTAVLTADGFNHRLAQDFWAEDLFNPKHMVRHHWIKLVWVFGLSGLIQLSAITALVAIPINFFRNGGADWSWPLIVIAAVTVIAVAMAVFIASAVWLDLRRQARQLGRED